MLTAIVILSLIAGAQAAELGPKCVPGDEQPSDTSRDFVASADDKVGIELNAYMIVDNTTYLPLKLQSVEKVGRPGGHDNSTLVIGTDCAKFEIDLDVDAKKTSLGTVYNGRSKEVRVHLPGSQQYTIKDKFVTFKSERRGDSLGYHCDWNRLSLTDDQGVSRVIVFNALSFIYESMKVKEKHYSHVKNTVGYQCVFQ